ncbi:MAG: DNA polymerase III subunit alpha, partial [Anaerolineales bacterium]
MFTHLRTHSHYSFLEGLPSPTQLAQVAADEGMPALALTDRRYLTGAVEFYEACHAVGVKPILGLELDLATPAELPHAQPGVVALLAQDMQGWGTLCRLSSALLTQPGHIQSGTIPFDLLAENTTGLICLTGGHQDLLSQWSSQDQGGNAQVLLGYLNEIFPQRLYVELQRHNPEIEAHSNWLAQIAQRMRLPTVATQSVYYLDPDQAHLQRLLTAMRLNCHLNEVPRDQVAAPKAHFLSTQEMRNLFSDQPDSLETIQEITERCNLQLPLGEAHYPEFDLPTGVTPIQALRERAFSGAKERYTEITPQIEARLEHELGIIAESGYAPLFLIMAEITQYAREKDVPISSRGSAASSLVAHCLGITDPDPMRLNLYFERFLNPARRTPPDIDTDLCSRRREVVIQHVYDAYGADRVAMVCTINRFRRRSAFREVAKAHGMSPAEIKPMVDALPWRGWGPPGTHRSSADSPYTELEGHYNTPRHKAIFQDAAAILGAPRHLSIHPGGVVISPGPMTDLAPTQLSSKGVVITQFDLGAVERLGLVKIDLLGIRGLTVLGDVADTLRERPPHVGKRRLAVLNAIPEQDPSTADLVRGGNTIGCFQIESPGMRATLKEIEASSVDDLMVALALYRPGPLTGGLKNAFVRRHLGQEPVSHLHSRLEPLLANTYGVILYQEQVLRIAHELAGLSLAEADLLRRAM